MSFAILAVGMLQAHVYEHLPPILLQGILERVVTARGSNLWAETGLADAG